MCIHFNFFVIFRFIFLYKNIAQQSSVTVRHVDFAEGKINIQVWRVPLFTVDPRHGASDYRQNGFFAASQKPRDILKTNGIRVKPLQRKPRSTTVPAFENRTLLAGKIATDYANFRTATQRYWRSGSAN